ncbi:MAG TPA: SRPBCC domain-containing protein, partial [Aggregatilineales bacterium]|nr:SRPBCC domain-containing protein [Aggregatilineales bacterium]
TWQGNGLDTLVTFTIEPTEGGTRLRLEHAGFAKSGKIGLTVRDLLASGWNSRILRERLPALLAQRAHSALSNNGNNKQEIQS